MSDKTKWLVDACKAEAILVDSEQRRVFAAVVKTDLGLYVVEFFIQVRVHSALRDEAPKAPGTYVSCGAAMSDTKRYVDWVFENAMEEP